MTWQWILTLVVIGAIVYLADRFARNAPRRNRHYGPGHIRQALDHRAGRFGGAYPEDTLPREGAARVGRNEPCPCGSSKKFKRCCGRESV